MYAIIQTGGKQYQVTPGDTIQVELLAGQAGETVVIPQVLFVAQEDQVLVGRPFLEEIFVEGEILRQGRQRKVLVFKQKRRKGYRKKVGHRQPFTALKIKSIQGV